MGKMDDLKEALEAEAEDGAAKFKGLLRDHVCSRVLAPQADRVADWTSEQVKKKLAKLRSLVTEAERWLTEKRDKLIGESPDKSQE